MCNYSVVAVILKDRSSVRDVLNICSVDNVFIPSLLQFFAHRTSLVFNCAVLALEFFFKVFKYVEHFYTQ